jgi:RNA polymerase sigma-70 factor (ECF subfamily)
MTDHSTSSDKELVRAAQNGELEAFTRLYERYLPIVYRRVRYKIPEPDVEDVTQEVFISVMKSLENFRHESQFSTWLRTLTNRQIADYYRSRTPPEIQLNLDVLYTNPGRFSTEKTTVDNIDNMDKMIMIRQSFGSLPEHYQEILLLRFADGLRFKDIAQLLGQSLEGTKSLYRRAVAKLSEQVSNA